MKNFETFHKAQKQYNMPLRSALLRHNLKNIYFEKNPYIFSKKLFLYFGKWNF